MCRAAPRRRLIVGGLCGLYERQLHLQAFVAACAVGQVAVVAESYGLVEPLRLAALSLFGIALANVVAGFEQLCRGGVAADEQVAQVCGQSADERSSVEAFLEHFVEEHEALADFLLEHKVS